MIYTHPRLLIVIQESESRKGFVRELREHFIIVEAESGFMALDILEQSPEIDLVLVERDMPVMDGLETLQRAREFATHHHTPAVLLVDQMDQDPADIYRGGAVDLILKGTRPPGLPFKLRNLAQLGNIVRTQRERLSIDESTGLPDLALSMRNIRNEYDRCRRAGTPLALIKLHLDGVDNLWMEDERLSRNIQNIVTNLLESSFKRPNDRIGHTGNGEFIVSSADLTLEPLQQHLNALRLSLYDLGIPHHHNAPFSVATLSIGAAIYTPVGQPHELEQLIRASTEALHKAAADKNSVVCCHLKI